MCTKKDNIMCLNALKRGLDKAGVKATAANAAEDPYPDT